MFLREVVLQNFRGYKNQHRIPIDQLTAFIGKNDVGKSSIFDALAVFLTIHWAKLTLQISVFIPVPAVN